MRDQRNFSRARAAHPTSLSEAKSKGVGGAAATTWLCGCYPGASASRFCLPCSPRTAFGNRGSSPQPGRAQKSKEQRAKGKGQRRPLQTATNQTRNDVVRLGCHVGQRRSCVRLQRRAGHTLRASGAPRMMETLGRCRRTSASPSCAPNIAHQPGACACTRRSAHGPARAHNNNTPPPRTRVSWL